MPSDVTGSPVYDERIHDFRFRPGPVLTQLLLADEINRHRRRPTSALLEIMQETRVTIDGTSHAIEALFPWSWRRRTRLSRRGRTTFRKHNSIDSCSNSLPNIRV